VSSHVPRVSIGIPVFNGERYLEEAIRSIIDQTFTDLELVISDNASTDGTAEICQRYAALDRRVRYHRNAHNIGGSANFKRVFELSRGEYFKWAAYDDLIAPQFLEKAVDILDHMPSVVLCYARTVVIDEHGGVVRPYADNLNLRSPSPSARYREFHYRFRSLEEPDPIATNLIFALIRRDVMGQTPLIAPYVNSDVDLIGDLAIRGEFYELSEELFFRRDHPNIPSRAFPTARDRTAWYQLSGINKALSSHPGWVMLYARLRSVTRVPMSPRDKARCYLLLARYFSWLVQGSINNLVKGVRT
jgi:glycosyltransferase involved in cell wall biosynthesis